MLAALVFYNVHEIIPIIANHCWQSLFLFLFFFPESGEWYMYALTNFQIS